MDRRRATSLAASNGLTISRRQRHRTTSTLIESSSLDEEMELRLRDRASLKKDNHHHNSHRERDRLMVMSSSSSSKRRRAERLSVSSNNSTNNNEDDGNTSEEEEEDSVSNDEDDEDEGRILVSSSQRKSFPPPYPTPSSSRVSRAVDEMIGVSVPRKARSASTKRSHESWSSAGFISSPGREQIHCHVSSSPVRPASPSCSNASVRKKMKPNVATKPKMLPKSSTKAAPTALPAAAAAGQDEIEIEIAEVLYGLMRQPQKQENSSSESMKIETNKSSTEAKSMASSPISNSQSVVLQSSTVLQQNSSCSAVTVSVLAPKRKKPREVKYKDENSSVFAVRRCPISSSQKADSNQPSKTEAFSCSLAANTQPSAVKTEREAVVCESKPPMSEEIEKKESHELTLDVVDDKNMTAIKEVVESKKEERFQIDLMATPSSRSSPDGDVEGNEFGDKKDMVTDMSAQDEKPKIEEDEKAVTSSKEDRAEAKKAKEEAAGESKKPVNRERNIDLQLDLEKKKNDKDGGNRVGNHLQKNDKIGQPSSLPPPMSVAGWPGGVHSMGYMPPFQGVVPMDGNVMPSAALQPPQMLFTQPRPPRCATHFYIARNICYHQQFTRMNPFLQAAVGSASLYGAKACNLNVVPPAELHGNTQTKGLTTAQENGHALGFFPGLPGKDKSSQSANIADAQRNQILLQQALPPGPAFIFPVSQQQAAAAAGQQGNAKFAPTIGTAAASSAPSNSTSVTGVTTGPATAPAMNFNFPTMPSSEAQYLALLPNNAYPFPVPGHVGAPAYRGNPSQPLSFFNGSFYSSQMLYPSQFQQQQPPSVQLQQSQQPHQSTTTSSSSSSQKVMANQQGHHKSVVNNCSGSSQGLAAPKNQTSQQQQGQFLPHQSRQLGIQMGVENSTSSENRSSHPNMSVYNQNFPVSFLPANFALITPPSASGSSSMTISSGNQGEQKQQQQQQGSQGFAMSFASINGASASPAGIDMSSIAQNHAFLQSLPEATRQSYQIMAAAAAAQATQQKKNYSNPDEGKGGAACSNMNEERKGTAGKPSATGSQAIAFSRSDMIHSSTSSMPGSSFIDSSSRTLNLGYNPAQSSASASNASLAQQQMQRNNTNLSLQQQYMQLQKQQQYAAAAASAAAKSKTPESNSGTAYSDHHSSTSSMVSKIPSTLSGFPSNIVQSSSSSVQTQSKSSGRTSTSQVSLPHFSSSLSTTLKNLPHQQSRTQQSHSQISFSANPKSSNQGQTPSISHSSSPHIAVGSPTTSSVSKNSGKSPRTTASSGNKPVQASSLSSLQAKNPPVQSQKTTPVGAKTFSSSFGSTHFNSSNSGTRSQLPQQQQLLKQTQQSPQQHQLFFSTAYMPAQAQQPSSTSLPANSVYYIQRRQSEQPPKTQQMQLQGSSTPSSGIFSMCPPVTVANTSTSDPSKAVAAATTNVKGAGVPSQGLVPAAQFGVAQSSGSQQLPAGFSYIHSIPAAVQVKPAEKKQP